MKASRKCNAKNAKKNKINKGKKTGQNFDLFLDAKMSHIPDKSEEAICRNVDAKI